jgi:hypothetical protein
LISAQEIGGPFDFLFHLRSALVAVIALPIGVLAPPFIVRGSQNSGLRQR